MNVYVVNVSNWVGLSKSSLVIASSRLTWTTPMYSNVERRCTSLVECATKITDNCKISMTLCIIVPVYRQIVKVITEINIAS